MIACNLCFNEPKNVESTIEAAGNAEDYWHFLCALSQEFNAVVIIKCPGVIIGIF